MSIENRDTFFARLERPPFKFLLTPLDLILIEAMYVLAKYGHRDQERKAPPGEEPERYFEHPRAVTLILLDELQLSVTLVIMLGLGHDCDEDSKQIRWEMLGALFGQDFAFRLRLLSKRGKTKEEYVSLLWQYGDWETLMVKAADRLHNLRTLPPHDPAFCRKQIAETRAEYLPLFKHLVAITPPGHKEKAERIRFMIQQKVVEWEERFRLDDAAAAKPPVA